MCSASGCVRNTASMRVTARGQTCCSASNPVAGVKQHADAGRAIHHRVGVDHADPERQVQRMHAERQPGDAGPRVPVPRQRRQADLVEPERRGQPVQILVRQLIVAVVLRVLDLLDRHPGALRQLLFVEARAAQGLVEHVAEFVFKRNGTGGGMESGNPDSGFNHESGG